MIIWKFLISERSGSESFETEVFKCLGFGGWGGGRTDGGKTEKVEVMLVLWCLQIRGAGIPGAKSDEIDIQGDFEDEIVQVLGFAKIIGYTALFFIIFPWHPVVARAHVCSSVEKSKWFASEFLSNWSGRTASRSIFRSIMSSCFGSHGTLKVIFRIGVSIFYSYRGWSEHQQWSHSPIQANVPHMSFFSTHNWLFYTLIRHVQQIVCVKPLLNCTLNCKIRMYTLHNELGMALMKMIHAHD